MPTFSVIIPTFNSEKFIRRTIQSVLDQTYKDFELIVVDDGSKDETQAILKELEIKDQRIKTLFLENSGSAIVPTNRGIEMAKGTYIAFLDHDDQWKENKLELVEKAFNEGPEVGFVATNVEVINEITGNRSISKPFMGKEGLPIETLPAGDYFNTMSMLTIRHDVVKKLGGLDPHIMVFGDYDFIARMLQHEVAYVFLPEPLTLYTIHENNMSAVGRATARRIQDLEYIITKHHSKFAEYRESLSKVQHAIARLYLLLGKRKEARRYFKEAIQNDKTNVMMYLRFLSTYLGSGFYDALSALKRKLLPGKA
jgi:glycosyltransferase involved in cell wall biosynthesis